MASPITVLPADTIKVHLRLGLIRDLPLLYIGLKVLLHNHLMDKAIREIMVTR